MVTKTKKLGFKITGEFVTEHARSLCLDECDWDGGYRFLTDSVEGVDHEIAVAILSGEKRLVGQTGYGISSTLDLEDEIPERKVAINERMDYLWSSIVKERSDYWRPYAYVTNSGSKCEYMNDPQNDRVEYVAMPKGHKHEGSKVSVLFEKVSQPPIWYKSILSGCWEESVAAVIKAKGLYETSHVQRFEGPELTAFDDTREAIRDIDEIDSIANKTASSLVDDILLEQTGIDSEAVAGIMSLMSGDSEETSPTPDDPKDHNYGWILRDGTFYGCMYHHHASIAKRIWMFIEKTTDGDKLADPEKSGDEAGWIKVTKSALDGEYKMMCCKKPTPQQKSTLGDWAVWHKQDANDLEVFN